MWELNHTEGWATKNWCFWTVVLEKTLQSPLHSNEIKSGNLTGNQPWIFIERTDAEAKAWILWPPDVKGWLSLEKTLMQGKFEEEKGATEDELVGCHHWFNGQEFEQTPGNSEGQGSLVCSSPWGLEESDRTWRLDSNTDLNVTA